MAEQTVLEKCKNAINSTIDELYNNQDSVDSFLQLIANIPFMDLDNLLLLYHQCPTAKILAGYGAWINVGREIIPDSKPLILRKLAIEQLVEPLPLIRNEEPTFDDNGNLIYADYGRYEIKYEAVYVFDVSQTQGKNIQGYFNHNEINFYKVITSVTNIAVRIDSDNNLEQNQRSKYDEQDNVLYIQKDLSDYDREIEYLKHFIFIFLKQYISDERDNIGMYILHCVTRIISIMYGFSMKQSSFFINSDFSKAEYIYILQHVLLYTNLVIEVIDNVFYLTFNETSVINYIYKQYPKSKKDTYFYNILNTCENYAREKSSQDILSQLNNKLQNVSISSKRLLYELREEKKLYTYPPIKLNKEKCKKES